MEIIMLKKLKKDEFCLPITNPVITSYMSYAPALSVLCNYKQCEGWIYSNFINLYGEYCDSGATPLRFHPKFPAAPQNPFMDLYLVPRDIALHNSQNIVEFFIYAITNGYYIISDYDEFYVEFTDAFNKHHKNHQIFIYGYDNNSAVFYTAEFFENRAYAFRKVPYNQIEDAIMQYDNIEKFDIWMTMLEFKQAEYKFDSELFFTSVNDYLLSSSCTISWEESKFCKSNKIIYGISNYKNIMTYLSNLKSGDMLYKDIRALYALCDHKKIMISRLKYIKENNIFEYDNQSLDIFCKLHKICLLNINLFIKYLLSDNGEILLKIIENMKRVEENELIGMRYLLK